jgi:Ca-activated chloride channel homolog
MGVTSMRRGFIWNTVLTLLAAASQVYAQSVAPAEGSFSIDVNLVVLHATVLNKKGGFVSGLDKQDFRILEDGKPQVIRDFSHGDVPVAVGLIVDNSGSMRPKRADVTAAAESFVQASNPQDQIFIINFNENPRFGLGNTKMFSANKVDLEEALNGIPARGKTALYDAILMGLDHLKKTTLDKKVLIVISDGGDNASTHTLPQVLHAAEQSDAIVYTVGLFDQYDDDRNPGVLKKIARATGGECFLPDKISKVVQISDEIARDIRNQYTLGYLPSDQNLNNGYRTIQVTATGPHHEKCVVRTRTGYVAAAQPKQGDSPQ